MLIGSPQSHSKCMVCNQFLLSFPKIVEVLSLSAIMHNDNSKPQGTNCNSHLTSVGACSSVITANFILLKEPEDVGGGPETTWSGPTYTRLIMIIYVTKYFLLLIITCFPSDSGYLIVHSIFIFRTSNNCSHVNIIRDATNNNRNGDRFKSPNYNSECRSCSVRL